LEFEDDKSLLSLYWEVNDYFAQSAKERWGDRWQSIGGWGDEKRKMGW